MAAVNNTPQHVYLKVTGTLVYLEITATRFMQPTPILTPPSTKVVLGPNTFRPAHILQRELPADAKPQARLGPSHMKC